MGRKRSQSLRRIPFYNSISVLRINIQKGDKVPGCKWKKASLKSKYCYPRYYLVTKLASVVKLNISGRREPQPRYYHNQIGMWQYLWNIFD